MADYGITVKELDNAVGKQLAGGQDWFYVEEQPVVIHNDRIEPHPPPIPPHVPVPAMTGAPSDWMFLDDIGVIREGCVANCLHVTTGRSWFTIPS